MVFFCTKRGCLFISLNGKMMGGNWDINVNIGVPLDFFTFCESIIRNAMGLRVSKTNSIKSRKGKNSAWKLQSVVSFEEEMRKNSGSSFDKDIYIFIYILMVKGKIIGAAIQTHIKALTDLRPALFFAPVLAPVRKNQTLLVIYDNVVDPSN